MRAATLAIDVRGELEVLREQLAALHVRVVALEAGRGPRDAADVSLLHAIHDAAAGLPFTASAVLVRARHVPALAAALEGADITSPRQLGKLLARCAGVTPDGGVRLVRVRCARGGWLWATAQVSHV